MDKIKCYDVNGNVLNHLVQWDKNQKIYIEDLVDGIIPEVHFGKEGNSTCYEYLNSISLINGRYVISIPNELLQDSFRLYIYLYYNDEYTTKYYIPLFIIAKPKPEGYILDDNIEKVPVSQILSDIDKMQKNINTLQVTLDSKLTLPLKGSVGQILEIASVDANGKPLTFIAVNKPSGGSGGSSSSGTLIWTDDNEGNVFVRF